MKVSMGMPMQCNENANDLTAREMLGRAIIAAATTRLLERPESRVGCKAAFKISLRLLQRQASPTKLPGRKAGHFLLEKKK